MAELDLDRVTRTILEQLIEGCQVIGPDLRYLYVNDAVARQARRAPSALVGRTMMECFPGIDRTPMFDVLRRVFSTGATERLENEFHHDDGSSGWFELRFVPVPEGVCILSRDITDEKNALASFLRNEDRLRHMQKMDAVGRIAGAIAHDFNNLLAVILSCAGVALESLRAADPVRADVEEIKKAAERAARLTRQVLSFSHHQVVVPQPVDLDEVIAGIEGMMRRLAGDRVRFSVRRSERRAIVKADPGQLEQILVNLTTNARDAMQDGGDLVVETSTVRLTDEAVARQVGVPVGEYVMLAVSDTGIGMDAATQARIFEPFFTTKPKGSGTGLGLATVFGIVRQSGGNIWLYSEVGRGTTFKIYLPSTLEESTASAERRAEPKPVLGHGEVLLVVEDRDELRAVLCDVLRRARYEVLEARSPAEAIGIARTTRAPIRLLVADVMLPQMSGPDLATHVRALTPDVRVLFMSGYTEHATSKHRFDIAPEEFLQKPITPELLLSRVTALLAR